MTLPANSQQPPQKAGPGNQPDQGPNHAYHNVYNNQSSTIKGPMQPIYGIFREHIALVIRKKHLDAQHISYKREISHLFLQDWET